MADFNPGDVVVLKSGSMRMLVERVDEAGVAVVWANDGGIGRDVLPAFALNRWEDRGPREEARPFTPRPPRSDDDRPARPFTPRPDGDRPPRPFGGKPGGGKPFGGKPAGDRPFAAKPAGDRPFKPGGDRPFGGGKPGMDGKPRPKNFYRKDE